MGGGARLPGSRWRALMTCPGGILQVDGPSRFESIARCGLVVPTILARRRCTLCISIGVGSGSVSAGLEPWSPGEGRGPSEIGQGEARGRCWDGGSSMGRDL